MAASYVCALSDRQILQKLHHADTESNSKYLPGLVKRRFRRTIPAAASSVPVGISISLNCWIAYVKGNVDCWMCSLDHARLAAAKATGVRKRNPFFPLLCPHSSPFRDGTSLAHFCWHRPLPTRICQRTRQVIIFPPSSFGGFPGPRAQ